MNIKVLKFGGSSLATMARIKRVARLISVERSHGEGIVVVVSAQGDATDKLMKMAMSLNPDPPEREIDMLLATGEQSSAALLAIAIQALGTASTSLTGFQAGILTETVHTTAKIKDINSKRMLKELSHGKVVIVTGFQGVTVDHDITTLGRGGSDLTAVALAAKLKAEVCEIYTDVEGVFSADPRIVPNARLISQISYEEMLEIAATGGKVLQLRSVEYGRSHGVKIHVRSSFTGKPGTLVIEEVEMEEKPLVSAVTHDVGEAKVTLYNVPDQPGIAARVFGMIANSDVNVDMIVQNVSRKNKTDISFTVPIENLKRLKEDLPAIIKDIKAQGFDIDENIAKVSLVGAGMRSYPGIAAKMFKALAGQKINIQMISTSPIKIGCVISADSVKKAVRVLHKTFELDKNQAK